MNDEPWNGRGPVAGMAAPVPEVTDRTTGRATEAMGSVYGLLDLTVYGRQETFEQSPPGWPQFWRNTGEQWRINGRPTPQWERLASGRPDHLGAGAT
jgi:hypothetical protein